MVDLNASRRLTRAPKKSDLEQKCSVLLRELRRKKGLTLDEFEELSGGTVKAVVLGSYERGTRAISLARLAQIAELYEVPIQYFFVESKMNDVERSGRYIFDLRRITKLQETDSPLILVKRFLERIAFARSDWNGEVLSIRESDSETLSLLSDLDRSELEQTLKVNGFLFAR